MVILETSVFTRRVQALLSDEEYRKLQLALVLRPDLGVVIQGSGGLRKMRWMLRGRGKRGGVRVIYYWSIAYYKIIMLMIYAKYEQDDLTTDQIKVLRRIIEEDTLKDELFSELLTSVRGAARSCGETEASRAFQIDRLDISAFGKAIP